MKDNYSHSLETAKVRFLTYDPQELARRPGVVWENDTLCFPFLGAQTKVLLSTGDVIFSYDGFRTQQPGDFSTSLAVYDWLCDAKADAAPAGTYCPVHSLPGVLVRGMGLSMDGGTLSLYFDKHPERLEQSCRFLGGTAVDLGDVGFFIPIFSNLSMMLKFYHSDMDFPPSMTLLWDTHTLDFLKYETVYYIADCLMKRLAQFSGCLS